MILGNFQLMSLTSPRVYQEKHHVNQDQQDVDQIEAIPASYEPKFLTEVQQVAVGVTARWRFRTQTD